MKSTDYEGLGHFQDYFDDLREHYVVIGGFATVMLLDRYLDGHGKATTDIDLVLISTNNTQMSQRLKQYIKDGGYTIQRGTLGQYSYFRFKEPKAERFARELEIFASNENNIELDDDQRIIPIDPEDGLYSLSAIMLDSEYFEMIKNNIQKGLRAPCTNTQATMMLKMSAFRDLKARGDDKYKKHRRDILKLVQTLTGEEKIVLVGRMIEDFDSFVAHLTQEVDDKMLKDITQSRISNKGEILDMLKEVFVLEPTLEAKI